MRPERRSWLGESVKKRGKRKVHDEENMKKGGRSKGHVDEKDEEGKTEYRSC